MLGIAAVLVLILAVILFLMQGQAVAPVTEIEPDEALMQLDESEADLDSLDTELEMLEQDYSDL